MARGGGAQISRTPAGTGPRPDPREGTAETDGGLAWEWEGGIGHRPEVEKISLVRVGVQEVRGHAGQRLARFNTSPTEVGGWPGQLWAGRGCSGETDRRPNVEKRRLYLCHVHMLFTQRPGAARCPWRPMHTDSSWTPFQHQAGGPLPTFLPTFLPHLWLLLALGQSQMSHPPPDTPTLCCVPRPGLPGGTPGPALQSPTPQGIWGRLPTDP